MTGTWDVLLCSEMYAYLNTEKSDILDETERCHGDFPFKFKPVPFSILNEMKFFKPKLVRSEHFEPLLKPALRN